MYQLLDIFSKYLHILEIYNDKFIINSYSYILCKRFILIGHYEAFIPYPLWDVLKCYIQ